MYEMTSEFYAGIHGAIFRAVLDAWPMRGDALWSFVGELCSFRHTDQSLFRYCVHGTGHGIVLAEVSRRLQVTALAASDEASCEQIISPSSFLRKRLAATHQSRRVLDEVFQESLQLCHVESLQVNHSTECTGGFVHEYWKLLSGQAAGVEHSVCTSLGVHIMVPDLLWQAHECFFYALRYGNWTNLACNSSQNEVTNQGCILAFMDFSKYYTRYLSDEWGPDRRWGRPLMDPLPFRSLGELTSLCNRMFVPTEPRSKEEQAWANRRRRTCRAGLLYV
jgi:hypothetical protein